MGVANKCLVLLLCLATSSLARAMLSRKEMARQLSPSLWNPKREPQSMMEQYENISANETAKARKELECMLDIEYGESEMESSDYYGIDLPDNATIFLWIHGGFWQSGSRDIGGIVARTLHKQGIKNVVMGYVLAPDAPIREMEDELLFLIKEVMLQFPNAKFIVGGHSAGAQLAVMLLHRTKTFYQLYDRLKGLVLVSGIYDLNPLLRTPMKETLQLNQALAEESSPLRHKVNKGFFENAKSRVEKNPTNDNFRVLVMMGEYDSPEFKRQSVAYYAKLKRSFPKSTFWKGKSDDHFSIVENLRDERFPSGQTFINFIKQFK